MTTTTIQHDDDYLKDLLQVQTFPVPLTIQEQMTLFFLVDQMVLDIQSGEQTEPDIIAMQPVLTAIHTKFVKSFNGAGIATPDYSSFH